MSEEEWLSASDPTEMLGHLRRELKSPWSHRGRRRLYLFGCACCCRGDLVPEARAGVAVGVLAMAIGLLTHIHQKMARFLDPRVVNTVVRAMQMPRLEDGPDEPLPAA